MLREAPSHRFEGQSTLRGRRYLLVDGSGKGWHGRSDAAWVDREGTVMKLQGHVEMRRDAASGEEPVELVTRDVTAWPREHRIATDAPATISSTAWVYRSTHRSSAPGRICGAACG